MMISKVETGSDLETYYATFDLVSVGLKDKAHLITVSNVLNLSINYCIVEANFRSMLKRAWLKWIEYGSANPFSDNPKERVEFIVSTLHRVICQQ